MNKNLFDKNKNFLKKKMNLDIDQYDSITEKYFDFIKQDNKYNIKIDNQFFLYSKRNINEKCKKQLRNQINFQQKNIIIFGFGMGYHIEELIKILKKENIYEYKIIIIELLPEIFYDSLYIRDMEKIFDNYYDIFDIYLIDKNKMKNLEVDFYIENILLTYLDEFSTYGLNLFFWDNYSKVKNISYVLEQLTKNKMTYLKTNIYTIRLSEKMFLQNRLKNFHTIFSSKNINIIKDYYNGPVFIVSAGPSLDKNINLLHKVKNKYPIFAVGHAYKKLLSENIIPDLVAIIDPKKSQWEFINNIDNKDNTIIHHTLETYPKALEENFKYFTLNIKLNEGNKRFLNRIKKSDNGFLVESINGTSTSVAHEIFQLAFLLGSSKIIMLGQDLSYTDGLTHFKGDKYTKQVDTKNLIKKKGNYDEYVYTTHTFLNYKLLFENLIRFLKNIRPELEVINSTEGGIYIENTIVKDLDRVIQNINKSNYTYFNKNDFIKLLDSDKYEYINKISKLNVIEQKNNLISLKEFVKKNSFKHNNNNKNALLHKLSKYLNSLLKNDLLIDLNITSNSYFTSRVVKVKDFKEPKDLIFIIEEINQFIIECINNFLYSLNIIIKKSED
jgi:hypothetical protein